MAAMHLPYKFKCKIVALLHLNTWHLLLPVFPLMCEKFSWVNLQSLFSDCKKANFVEFVNFNEFFRIWANCVWNWATPPF